MRALPTETSAVTRGKGTNFRGLVGALRAGYGEDALEAILAEVGGEVTDLVRGGHLAAGEWYPVEWYRRLHHAARKVLGRGTDLPFELGHSMMCSDLGGVYRIFTLLATPKMLLSSAARVFGAYWTADLEILESDRRSALARWSGCVGFDENIWCDVMGGSHAVLESAGGKHVKIERLAGGLDGDASLDALVTWR